MKKCTLILATMLLTSALNAQQETLFSGDLENGGFGGPVLKFSQLEGKSAVFVGGRGGWIINHRVILGGGGYGLATPIPAKDDSLQLQFAYGGFELEYIFQPNRLIHFSIQLFVGAGGANLNLPEDDNIYEYDSVFVLEPASYLILNVTTGFHLGLGAGYRYVSGVNLPGYSNADLSGFSATLVFQFGRF